MEFSNVTQTAFASAAILSLILCATLITLSKRTRLHWSFPLAILFQTLWLASVPLTSQIPQLGAAHLLCLETLHYAAWMFALIKNTEVFCRSNMPLIFRSAVYGISAAAIVGSIFVGSTDLLESHIEKFIIWQGIAFSILGLLCLEQLYRNVVNYRLIKLICLNLAIVFAFDAYLFSQNLIFPQLNSDLWQARAAVAMATSVFMTIGVAVLNQPSMQSARITFSRPVAFYTTSLTIAGGLLTILSIGGYYVELYGGSWGTILYTLVLVCGVIAVAAVFVSHTVRERMTVLINKHLFSHKYDYRAEWLKLINQLSQPTEPQMIHTRALKVVANLFKCNSGALWLKRGKILVPVQQYNLNLDVSEMVEPDSSAFCRELEQEWVFSPNSLSHALAQHNDQLPGWVASVDGVWLIIPLINERSLQGFMILTAPQSRASLNWEDLDLIKTVGRQIASYLERHEQSELLAESRQFDAFNKLSAYVMHDLKNLIAQQSLVVKNAEKHKDNPAFVDDTIHTINNSVTRMNNLLRKLQHNEPEEIKVLSVKQVLLDAVKRCQKSKPVPTLMTNFEDWKIKADYDSLVMVFTHIIQNAQDATSTEGYIDISAELESKILSIRIEDNGSGMDADFIQNRLFKPFETTKTGKGMGIGMFQAKDYTQNLGGNIAVESSVGEGTTFIITLPLL